MVFGESLRNLVMTPVQVEGTSPADLLIVGCSLARDLAGSYARLRISDVWHMASRRQLARPAGHSGVDLCKIPYADFPESS